MHKDIMPVTVQRWLRANAEKVVDYRIEYDEFGDDHQGGYSIWCYLEHGWINTSTEVHFIHEATAANFLESARFIEPCNCTDCEANDDRYPNV